MTSQATLGGCKTADWRLLKSVRLSRVTIGLLRLQSTYAAWVLYSHARVSFTFQLQQERRLVRYKPNSDGCCLLWKLRRGRSDSLVKFIIGNTDFPRSLKSRTRTFSELDFLFHAKLVRERWDEFSSGEPSFEFCHSTKRVWKPGATFISREKATGKLFETVEIRIGTRSYTCWDMSQGSENHTSVLRTAPARLC